MRRKPAIFLSAFAIAFSATSAFAADVQSGQAVSPLAPGHAAGIRNAEINSPSTPVLVAGGAVLAGGLALVLSNNGHDHTPGSGTTTTSSSGTH